MGDGVRQLPWIQEDMTAINEILWAGTQQYQSVNSSQEDNERILIIQQVESQIPEEI